MNMRVNWFPNPRFAQSGTQPLSSADCAEIVWRWAGRNGILLESKADTVGAFAEFRVALRDDLLNGPVAGQPFIFACEVGYTSEAPARGPIFSVTKDNGTTLAEIGVTKPAQRNQLVRFNAPADGIVKIKFRGPNLTEGNANAEPAVGFYDPQLELASTYDDRGGTPAYFNGDSLSGGGVLS